MQAECLTDNRADLLRPSEVANTSSKQKDIRNFFHFPQIAHKHENPTANATAVASGSCTSSEKEHVNGPTGSECCTFGETKPSAQPAAATTASCSSETSKPPTPPPSPSSSPSPSPPSTSWTCPSPTLPPCSSQKEIGQAQSVKTYLVAIAAAAAITSSERATKCRVVAAAGVASTPLGDANAPNTSSGTSDSSFTTSSTPQVGTEPLPNGYFGDPTPSKSLLGTSKTYAQAPNVSDVPSSSANLEPRERANILTTNLLHKTDGATEGAPPSHVLNHGSQFGALAAPATSRPAHVQPQTTPEPHSLTNPHPISPYIPQPPTSAALTPSPSIQTVSPEFASTLNPTSAKPKVATTMPFPVPFPTNVTSAGVPSNPFPASLATYLANSLDLTNLHLSSTFANPFSSFMFYPPNADGSSPMFPPPLLGYPPLDPTAWASPSLFPFLFNAPSFLNYQTQNMAFATPTSSMTHNLATPFPTAAPMTQNFNLPDLNFSPSNVEASKSSSYGALWDQKDAKKTHPTKDHHTSQPSVGPTSRPSRVSPSENPCVVPGGPPTSSNASPCSTPSLNLGIPGDSSGPSPTSTSTSAEGSATKTLSGVPVQPRNPTTNAEANDGGPSTPILPPTVDITGGMLSGTTLGFTPTSPMSEPCTKKARPPEPQTTTQVEPTPEVPRTISELALSPPPPMPSCPSNIQPNLASGSSNNQMGQTKSQTFEASPVPNLAPCDHPYQVSTNSSASHPPPNPLKPRGKRAYKPSPKTSSRTFAHPPPRRRSSRAGSPTKYTRPPRYLRLVMHLRLFLT